MPNLQQLVAGDALALKDARRLEDRRVAFGENATAEDHGVPSTPTGA